MKFRKTSLAVAVSISLSACGGGDGGGGGLSATLAGPSSSSSNSLRSSVPFYEPVRINHFQPLTGTSYLHPNTEVYARDLNGDTTQEVVVQSVAWAGTQADWQDSALQIYGWNTGAFGNETARWFQPGENVNTGGSTVRFGDFRGNGRTDMFVAAFTDTMAYMAPSTVYLNNGDSTFTRQILDFGAVNPHDSIVTDLNGDGFSDVIVTDIGNLRPAVALGSAAGTFTVYRSDWFGGGAGISVADYLADGTQTIVLTDAPGTMVGSENHDTKLYAWQISAGKLELTEISRLPADRFYLPKWDAVRAANTISPHAVRNLAMDFNGDGRMDVIVFSALEGRGLTNGYSEIQFLRNDGGGTFVDVTDSVLVGYTHERSITYNPVIMDVNNDGIQDILISNANFGINDDKTTAVLLGTQEGRFVESHASVFQDFTNQIKAATLGAETVHPISVVRGPAGDLYMFSTVQYTDNGVAQMATYLSLIGSTGTVTAPATVAALQQVWPWMSAAEANAVLAQTAGSFVDGVAVIDLERIWSPMGDLTLGINGGRRILQGHVSVPGFDSGKLRNITALDAVGRDFRVDLSVMEQPTVSFTADQILSAAEPEQNWTSRLVGDVTQHSLEFTVTGRTSDRFASSVSSRRMGITEDWDVNLGIARMPGSPWMSFSGVFGRIENSVIVDTTVGRYWKNGAFAQGSIMQTTTDFQSGLIDRISPLWSASAMAGWQGRSWSIYSGVQPTIFSGSMTMTLPTGIDNQGQVQYTRYNTQIRNDPVMFAGAHYRWRRQADSMTASAAVNDQGSYRVQFNYRKEF
jgi:hypothetical protein